MILGISIFGTTCLMKQGRRFRRFINKWMVGYGNGNAGEKDIPYWFGFNEKERSISASVEPSGLQFSAFNIEEHLWNSWLVAFKAAATEIPGFKVGELEEDEVGYEIEWII